jgi:hypothetical protein
MTTMLTILGTLEEPLWIAAALYPIAVGLLRFVAEKVAETRERTVPAPLPRRIPAHWAA